MTSNRWRCTRRWRFATSARQPTSCVPVYDATERADGYVSLEVSPYLAHDTAATIEDARRLWKAVGRDNLMIKVPGTVEGVPAIRQLISEGVNVNITLLFGVGRYAEVATAYIDGLSAFVEHGGDAAKVASVASFFVSRIDTMVDEHDREATGCRHRCERSAHH